MDPNGYSDLKGSAADYHTMRCRARDLETGDSCFPGLKCHPRMLIRPAAVALSAPQGAVLLAVEVQV